MKHFKEEEFNMGGVPCFDKMNPNLIHELDLLRGYVNIPFKITSSYRDEEYNRSVGGGDNSQHLLGNAIDISTIGWTGVNKHEFLSRATEMNLSIGIYDTFFHIDYRNSRPVIWVG